MVTITSVATRRQGTRVGCQVPEPTDLPSPDDDGWKLKPMTPDSFRIIYQYKTHGCATEPTVSRVTCYSFESTTAAQCRQAPRRAVSNGEHPKGKRSPRYRYRSAESSRHTPRATSNYQQRRRERCVADQIYTLPWSTIPARYTRRPGFVKCMVSGDRGTVLSYSTEKEQ